MEYHFQAHVHITTDHHPDIDPTMDLPPTITMKEDTGAVDPDHNLILADTTGDAAMTPTGTVPGYVTETANDIKGVLSGAHTHMPIHITPTKTHHIYGHPCTEALQLTVETTADHDLTQHTNQPGRPHTKIHHNQDLLW